MSVPEFFVDAVNVESSLFSIVLHAGVSRTLQGAEPGVVQMTFEERVVIVMSPQHLQALIPVLQKQVHLYEQQFGPLPSPGRGLVQLARPSDMH